MPEAHWLPVWLLSLTQSTEISEERVTAKIISIHEKGLLEPGELVIGINACLLKDGNHRLQAVKNLGWEYFPVRIRTEDRPIKKGIPLNKIFNELLKEIEVVKLK